MRYQVKDDPDHRVIEGRSPVEVITSLKGQWEECDLKTYMRNFRDRTAIAYGENVAQSISTQSCKKFLESLVNTGILMVVED
ncbi:MAG: hypothetical protein KME46_29760 [Brasilonema angustatum HA4187-MV1]|jgi:hypothetical protein|nr:hypothetical protein [Brasilonema angustatum HA4187-MV1]